jgi:hypothetical protein
MFRRPLNALSSRFPRFKAFREWFGKSRTRIKLAFVLTMHVLGAVTSMQAVMSDVPGCHWPNPATEDMIRALPAGGSPGSLQQDRAGRSRRASGDYP